MLKKPKGIGSTLENLLQEEGILEDIRIRALITTITLHIQAIIKKKLNIAVTIKSTIKK